MVHRKIRVSGRLDNQAAYRKSRVSDYDIKIVRTIDLDETAIFYRNFYIFVSLSNDRLYHLYFTFQYFRPFFERFQKAYRAYGFRIEVCFLSLATHRAPANNIAPTVQLGFEV